MIFKHLHKFDSLSAFTEAYNTWQYPDGPSAIVCSAGTFTYSGGPVSYDCSGLIPAWEWVNGSLAVGSSSRDPRSGDTVFNWYNCGKSADITDVIYTDPDPGDGSAMYVEPWVSVTDYKRVKTANFNLYLTKNDQEMTFNQPFEYVGKETIEMEDI